MLEFHEWREGELVFDKELGRVAGVARTRWGTPSARVVFDSGPRSITPPRRGARARVLDREVVAGFVGDFYARVPHDPLLGPVFAERVHDWADHVAHLTSFWASVLLAEGSFRGSPGPKHRAIAELTPAHFDRWLALFSEVVRAHCEGPAAEHVLARAEAMRKGLSALVFAPHEGAC